MILDELTILVHKVTAFGFRPPWIPPLIINWTILLIPPLPGRNARVLLIHRLLAGRRQWGMSGSVLGGRNVLVKTLVCFPLAKYMCCRLMELRSAWSFIFLGHALQTAHAFQHMFHWVAMLLFRRRSLPRIAVTMTHLQYTMALLFLHLPQVLGLTTLISIWSKCECDYRLFNLISFGPIAFRRAWTR